MSRTSSRNSCIALFGLLGFAAFGVGRKASRTGAGDQIPDSVGIALLALAAVLWVVIIVVVDVGGE